MSMRKLRTSLQRGDVGATQAPGFTKKVKTLSRALDFTQLAEKCESI